MNIWRAQGHDKDDSTVQCWETSEAKVRARFKNEYFGLKPSAVERVEIPTTATGLVEWLNQHFNRDNG